MFVCTSCLLTFPFLCSVKWPLWRGKQHNTHPSIQLIFAHHVHYIQLGRISIDRDKSHTQWMSPWMKSTSGKKCRHLFSFFPLWLNIKQLHKKIYQLLVHYKLRKKRNGALHKYSFCSVSPFSGSRFIKAFIKEEDSLRMHIFCKTRNQS